MKTLIAPNTVIRGVGINYTSGNAKSISDTHVEGYETNIACQNVPSLTMNNVRSVKAWRRDTQHLFDGQGLYLENVAAANISNSLFGFNGWQIGKPPGELNIYRHGIYSNFNSHKLVLDTCILIGNSNAGFQGRGGGILRNCVLIGNSISALLVQGNFELHDCTVYDGHFTSVFSTINGKLVQTGWGGNSALSVYYPTILRNTWIIGRKGQGDDPKLLANQKIMPAGAVVCSSSYSKPEWKSPGTKNLIDAQNCKIAGWPGKTFAGDIPHNGSGFQLSTQAISYDYQPTIDAVLNNQLSIPDAVKKLHQAIRA